MSSVAAAVSFQTVLVVVASLTQLFVSAKPAAIHCGQNEFRGYPSTPSPDGSSSGGRQACLPCSICPDNQIVRRPCSKLSDTICGPLYDWEFSNDNDVVTSVGGGRHRLVRLHGWRPPSAPFDLTDVVGVTNVMEPVSPTRDPGLLRQCYADDMSVMCYSLLCIIPTVFMLIIALLIFAWIRLCSRGKRAAAHSTAVRPHHSMLMVRQDGTTVYVHPASVDAIGAATGPLVVPVDRRVRHLETQLYRQRQQRPGRIFNGSTRSARTGNDYVDFLSWFRSVRGSGLDPETIQRSLLQSTMQPLGVADPVRSNPCSVL